MLLGYITGGHFAVHWFGQLFPMILPPVKVALHLSHVQVGFLSTMRELTTGLANLPAGILGDRLARHRPAILSSALLAFGVAYLTFGLAPGYLYALAAAGLVGVGIALWHPTAMASLSNRFPEHRATAFAIHGMGATVSDTLTPLVVGILFGLYPWHRSWHCSFSLRCSWASPCGGDCGASSAGRRQPPEPPAHSRRAWESSCEIPTSSAWQWPTAS